MKSLIPLRMLLAAGMLAFALRAHAQTARQPPAGGAAPQASAQFAAEKAQLQSQLASARKDLEDARAKLQAAGKEASGSRSGLAALKAQLAQAQEARQAAEASRDQLQAKLQELLDKYRQNTGALAGLETERGQLKQDLASATARLDVCAQRNVALYDAMNEALAKLGRGGFFTAMGRTEPFTKIERVRLENMVDEYRQRAEELKLRKSDLAGPDKPARGAGSR